MVTFMNVNRMMSFGSAFFTIVLICFGMLKYSAGDTRPGIFYLIGGLGFFIVFISNKNKEKKR
jgi:hypothetical protein